jgi:HAD superfamily hydrolase (TIGR01509 family)
VKLIRGVILDIDGTLIDSNDAHAQAWVEALKAGGHDVEFAKIRRLIGEGSDKLLPDVVGLDAESPEGKKLSQASGDIFKSQYLPHIQPFPGTRALVERMRERGLQVAVATSARGDEVHRLLEVAGVADLIEQRTSSEDVRESKPDPDVVQAALGSLGLPPDEVVMIGDTPYDRTAATAAAVPFIGFTCGGWGADDLSGAVAIFAGPADLLAKYEMSPLGYNATLVDFPRT